ncbi:MAG TPA: sigma-70 family RNA polymerase sigma factor [Candidatus Woesebacteria bacterium]|nr:sigma-70 family RNA polymerase sigma factor [Candidatus Woesebacteria bacterium]HPJ17433.1 sigma-70 family RNA polymerase sigma factor [Candidatus Woesebacteria bacterium]
MEEFYLKYYKSVRSFLENKIDDSDKVEELANDVLMAAYNSLPTFNQKCSEFSFICSIAKHKVVDYYRKKKIKTILFSANPIFEEIADQSLSPERDVLKEELKKEIGKTLKEIKEGSKKILRLKYVQGWTTLKIAKAFKLTLKATESRLLRARKEFQQSWNYDNKKAKETVENKRTNRD